ncbi:YigZ family protein [Psychrobacter sp. HD31]|uniref:YigZ family protein n=1 Tax=Psychrobacter sp. HD31 TaxID=3112003 RepID=UPI003DA6BB66
MSYQTLANAVTARIEIKKSDFIAYAYSVTSREQAMTYVEQLKNQYPDARHHCWAYIIGDPSNTTSAGFDDDGEPSGTAGRPILNVLQHKAIGNVIIIVVRYFGGIKLGAGGLTRAYAGSAQAVIDEMKLVPYIPMVQVQIATDYAHEAQIRYLIGTVAGQVDDVTYTNEVMVTATMEMAKVPEFAENLGVSGRILEQ